MYWLRNAIFVQASGTAPITYQWYDNNGTIYTATQQSYAIANVSASHAGSYYCVASNSCGSTQSTIKNLIINTPPDILQHPFSSQTCTGQNVNFSVSAYGTLPLSYQWYKDYLPMSGANQATLSLNNVNPSYSGVYYCRLSNLCGFVNSNDAILSIDTTVVITAQSGSISTCVSTSASFSVTASGTPPMSYQWYNNNGPIANATNNIFIINNVALSDAGDYYCIATNGCGYAQSSIKTLAVYSAPAISQQPQNIQACIGQSTLLALSASGSQPVSYQWYKYSVAVVGAVNNLYLFNSINASDSGLYYCELTNICGIVNSNVIQLSVNLPVTIISQSSDSNRCEGSQVSFSVNANGTLPIGYQWFKNGNPLQYDTLNDFILNNLQASDAGFYHAVITNVCGSVNTTNKNLNINLLPIVALGNDTGFCYGQTMVLSPGPGYSCIWNNGSYNPQLLVTNSGSYWVNVTDANGCSNSSDTISIAIPTPYNQEDICIVTVDPVIKKNVVVWEKTPFVGIAAYRVYKESNISGIYNLVAVNHVDSMSTWTDITSNPSTKSDRYRISVIDTCGMKVHRVLLIKPCI
jgi:hypothetical protein